MPEIFNRTKLLIGEEGYKKLAAANIAVIGIGGVGSYTVEGLVRGGIGKITLIDHDLVDITNINRQIHALHSTIGQAKVDVMARRLKDINPEIEVKTKQEFCTKENVATLLSGDYHYIIDAVDNITAKIAIMEYALANKIPVISSMGAANKLNNTNFQIVDISETNTCPLARVIRKELRNRGIFSGVKVVYSPDAIIKPNKVTIENSWGKKELPGSISFVPPVPGLLMAGYVINYLLKSI